MMRFLRHFWFVLRRTPPVPVNVPEWTDDERNDLRNFLENTGTGRNLLLQMQWAEAVQNVRAVTAMKDRDYGCGYAAGFRSALAWIHSISAAPPPQDGENNGRRTPAADTHAARFAA